jgi:hypothetical protein
MPLPCAVCVHPRKAAIDAAIVAGTPANRIAKTYGIGRKSVTGHRDNHLPPVMAQAHAAAEVARADDLVAQLQSVQAISVRLLDGAMTGELAPPDPDGKTIARLGLIATHDGRWAHPSIALRAVREIRGNLELLARLEGELEDPTAEATVTIVFDDEWRTGG